MNEIDLLIKNGHVIDPQQAINGVMDVAINNGKVVAIDTNFNAAEAKNVIDATGAHVVPGLIDLHAHIYWGATALSVDPNAIYKASGVTTFVDAGSAGAGNFLGLLEYVIKTSPINIFSFLNISFPGIFALNKNISVGECSVEALMSIDEAVAICQQYADYIVGIKARACQRAAEQNGLLAIKRALQVGEQTGLPIMTHIGLPPPTVEEVVKLLRPGDIITHAFRGEAPNTFVTADNKIKACFYEAKERGIIFDVGHGAAGFGFAVARVFAEQDIWPDTISSDVHIMSVGGPAYDLLTTMSKYLCLGMPLEKIIAATTATPAAIINKPNIGSLQVGNLADISILDIEKGTFTYTDGEQQHLTGDKRFVVKKLIKNGNIL